jgi:hypothetical protein
MLGMKENKKTQTNPFPVIGIIVNGEWIHLVSSFIVESYGPVQRRSWRFVAGIWWCRSG